MKLNLTNILKDLRQHVAAPIALAAVAVMGLWGCNGKEEPRKPGEPDPTEPDRQYLSLVVKTDAPRTGGSRVSDDPERPNDTTLGWGEPYRDESGNNMENRIDRDRLHVALFNAEGEKIGMVSTSDAQVFVSEAGSGANKNVYQVIFDVTDMGLTKNSEYIAVVLANIDRPSRDANLDDVLFNIDNIRDPNAPAVGPGYYSNGSLPMFGFLRWTMGDLPYHKPSGLPYIGEVFMLRSVCKIEVCIADGTEDNPLPDYFSFPDDTPPEFHYVGRHLNRKGHVAVWSSYWKSTDKTSVKDLTFEQSFFECTDQRWATSTDVNIQFKACSANSRSYYIYLPEASGASMKPNEDALRLNVTLSVPKESTLSDNPDDWEFKTVTGTIFPSMDYDEEGKPVADSSYNDWKLVRNHIYRFTITDYIPEIGLKYDVSESGDKTIEVPDFD